MDSDTRLLYFRLFNEIGIIAQLSRAMMDARLPGGLITPHFSVLNHLIRVEDGRTPLELARAFQVPKTTMTHTLSGLESQGLISVRPNPQDGRSKRVWITEAGRRFRDGAIEALDEDIAALAALVDREEVESLIGPLIEIRKILDAQRDRAKSTADASLGEAREDQGVSS